MNSVNSKRNVVNSLRKTRLVAIKNFDEELYRLVKVYASLEGRTIASIIEEALRYWMMSRDDFEEVRIWARLEELYEENLKVLNDVISRAPDKCREGFILICDGKFIGIFRNYDEALKESKSTCRGHGLIVKLPYKKEIKTIELGLPW